MKQIQTQIGRIRCGLVLLGILLFLSMPVSKSVAGNTTLTLDQKPLRIALAEGETTLIVRVPNLALLEKFALVNENTDARGELKISVSDACLSANDPKWNLVNGNIPFAHKRLFNLSMLGVEAKYVKLCFHVEKENRIASIGF